MRLTNPAVSKHRFQIFEFAKKVDVKFDDIFPVAEWPKRNLSYLSIILPLGYPDILNIFSNYWAFKISTDLRMRRQISKS